LIKAFVCPAFGDDLTHGIILLLLAHRVVILLSVSSIVKRCPRANKRYGDFVNFIAPKGFNQSCLLGCILITRLLLN
jgi:hypothetical protein